jgi:sterol desaturase/sphingolipid hydroxylase (fatty acid hydroxylase superfamily)
MIGPFDFSSFLIVALIFIPLEMISPLRPEQKRFRRHWGSDVANLLGNAVLIQLGLMATIAGMMAAIRWSVPAGVGASVRSQPVWLQLLEVILIADVFFYAAHRAFHRIPFLWKFHAVHHSIEEMDWLAAYRIHPLDQIVTKSISYLPLYALGFSDPAVIGFVLIFKWQSVFIHTNCRIDFGPLKWVLSSPQFHHWHHANEPAALDKNFAAQLPFLDLVFGTGHMPRPVPEKYGTDMPVPARYDRQLLYPFWSLGPWRGKNDDRALEARPS